MNLRLVNSETKPAPADTFPDETVLMVKATRSHRAGRYSIKSKTYVISKIAGRWWMAGFPGPLPWEGVLGFLDGARIHSASVAIDWAEVEL
jgi:hypothetical protein